MYAKVENVLYKEWRCYEDITHTISHLLIEVLEQEEMSSELII